MAIACAVGIALVTGKWCCENADVRAQRGEQKRHRELRELAEKISTYGRKIQQRYPTGDVVVYEADLAQQLRSRRPTITAALNVLRAEEKVREAPLKGYWKLNV